MGIAHLAFDFGARHQCRHRVDDQHVDRPRADQHIRDLQRLFTGVRLGEDQVFDIDAQLLGIDRVERVLGIDEGAGPALLLRLGDDRERQSGLARGFRAVDLDHPAPRQAADAQRNIQPQRARGNTGDGDVLPVSHPHHRALAELALNLAQGRLQCLFLVWIHELYLASVAGLVAGDRPPGGGQTELYNHTVIGVTVARRIPR